MTEPTRNYAPLRTQQADQLPAAAATQDAASTAPRDGRLNGFVANLRWSQCAPKRRPNARRVPIWQDQGCCLWFDGLLVKEFLVHSDNQEAILREFQRRRWPARIKNPIPHRPGFVDSQRLAFAVYRLNRHQINHLLRFVRDGTGHGVCWEPIYPSPPTPHPNPSPPGTGERGFWNSL